MNDTSQSIATEIPAVPSPFARAAWALLGAVLGVIALVLALYWPTMASLLPYWNDTSSLTYTHGYLIALLSLWLLIRARGRMAAAPIKPFPPAVAGVFLAGMAWLFAYQSAIQIGYQLLLPVLMGGAVWAVFGWRIARLCVFPLGYLYFAVPIWDSANALPQWGTVFAVRLMLRSIGLPAFFSDNYVQIPQGTFEIAGGCSGLHFFIVGLALAVLLGELRRDSRSARIKLAALAIGLALVSNWVRVFTIIIAGYLTDMQHYLVRVNHYYYGWALFAVAMALFFFLARRIGEEPPPEASPASVAVVPAAIGKVWGAGILTLVVMALPAAWMEMHVRAAGALSHVPLLPVASPGWSGPANVTAADDWEPRVDIADLYAHGVYTQDAGAQVEVVTAVYYYQRQGKELGGYRNSATGNLRITDSSRATVKGRTFTQANAVDSLGRRWVVWYGYDIGGRWFDDATRAQFWYGLRSLAGPRLSRALVLRSQCEADCDGARRALGGFIE